jgi:AcrR family transcriptional regulator
MPRPSQRIDQALLASGRALFPAAGCARLSVRAVAEHAGVNPAMLHYHFGAKDEFLRALLQQVYEEMFAHLAGSVQDGAAPRAQLAAALTTLARFARAERTALARLWMDALAGEPVAVEFFARNSPRHLGLLLGLLQRAQAEGVLRPMPALQAVTFLLGAVVLPILFVAGLVHARAVPAMPVARFDAQVLADAAIAERIETALDALAPAATLAPARRAGVRRAARPGVRA